MRSGICWNGATGALSRRFPAQPAGTVVRYYLAARMAAGEEMAADGGTFDAYYVTGLDSRVGVRCGGLPGLARSLLPRDGKVLEQPAPDRVLRRHAARHHRKTGLHRRSGGKHPVADADLPQPMPSRLRCHRPLSVEPRWGSKEDLRQLLDAAHAAGLRVLLDFVPNHWSDRHLSFQNAIADPAARMWSWYNFKDYPHEYESFFGVKELPQFNLRKPAPGSTCWMRPLTGWSLVWTATGWITPSVLPRIFGQISAVCVHRQTRCLDFW